MKTGNHWLWLLAGCLLLASPTAEAEEHPPPSQEAPPPERFNPLGDFEHHVLDNGMRVWIKSWPGSGVVHLSMGVPAGGSTDHARVVKLKEWKSLTRVLPS